jgi:hypothetical protein
MCAKIGRITPRKFLLWLFSHDYLDKHYSIFIWRFSLFVKKAMVEQKTKKKGSTKKRVNVK